MQGEIPFYKNEKIKKVNIIDNRIIVTKYLNKLYTYNVYLQNTPDNFKLIKKEFYTTLEEYLLNNKDKYFKSKKTNKKMGVKSILLIVFCGLGIYVPFLGLYLLNLCLIYVGILTMLLWILSLFYIGNSLFNKTVKNNREFCENYEALQKIFHNHLKENIRKIEKLEIKPIKMDKENEQIKKKVRKK